VGSIRTADNPRDNKYADASIIYFLAQMTTNVAVQVAVQVAVYMTIYVVVLLALAATSYINRTGGSTGGHTCATTHRGRRPGARRRRVGPWTRSVRRGSTVQVAVQVA
jgi:hypothetical protein